MPEQPALSRIEVGPDQFLAAAVVEAALNGAVASVNRFRPCSRHFVYDVALTDGRRAVVRLGGPEQRVSLESAALWSDRLRPLGVKMPSILARDLTSEFPYLVLERLPGANLDSVFDQISLPGLGMIAGHLAEIQRMVARLPSAGRFGTAPAAELAPYIRWSDVLAQSLVESRAAIRRFGLIDESVIDGVEQRFAKLTRQLDTAPSIPFLPELTASKVIINDQGLFSGIIDLDLMCWGDPRYSIASAVLSLLNQSRPIGYAEAWLSLAGGRIDASFWLYVATACVDRMAMAKPVGDDDADEDQDRLPIVLGRMLNRIDREIGA